MTDVPEETQEYILRAMALNYDERHCWDRLDAQASNAAADEINALRAALADRAARSGEPVAVKALEWNEPEQKPPVTWTGDLGGIYIVAQGITGRYCIHSFDDNASFWVAGLNERFSTLDAAQAASQADYERRIRSALVAAPPSEAAQAEPVAVKALEWERPDLSSHERAYTPIGVYRIRPFHLAWNWGLDAGMSNYAASSDDAKAAAQADYERRIRSALVAVTPPEAPQAEREDGVVYVNVSGLTGTGKSAICGEIEIALKAIGVTVDWANGASEKRMTHADWQEAIDLYKPRVVITERNVPRAHQAEGGEA